MLGITLPAGSTFRNVTLKRSYGKTADFTQDYSRIKNTFINQTPIAIIVKGTLPTVNRENDYVKYQAMQRFKSGTLT